MNRDSLDWKFDLGKGLYYRSISDCHGVGITQKMLYEGKVVKDSNFKIVNQESIKKTEKIPNYRKWWKFWIPKYTIKHRTVYGQTVKNVCFRWFCNECGKQCKMISEVKTSER